jgi:signal transduction histidine kinase
MLTKTEKIPAINSPASQAESWPAIDMAASLSYQILGCSTDLQAIAHVLGEARASSTPLPPEVVTYLYRVIRDLRRLGNATLSLSRTVSDPEQLFSLAPLDLERLVEEVVAGFKARGVDGRLQLYSRLSRARVWWGQPEQLKMILDSLISPLLHYAACDSRITLSLEAYHGYLEREHGYLLVSMTNPDTFLPAAEVDQLFIKPPPERSFDRLADGLNLYVARKLIEIHGGQLEAEAAAGGLTFWFTLPLVEDSQERYDRC